MPVISFIGVSPGGAKRTRFVIAKSIAEAKARAKNMGFAKTSGFKVVPKKDQPKKLQKKEVRKTLAQVGKGYRAPTTPKLKPKERALATAPLITTPGAKLELSGLADSVMKSLLAGFKQTKEAPLEQIKALLNPAVSKFLSKAPESAKTLGRLETGVFSETMRGVGAGLGEQLPEVKGKKVGKFLLEALLTDPIAWIGDIPAKQLGAQRLKGEEPISALDILKRPGEKRELGRQISAKYIGREPTKEEIVSGLGERMRARGATAPLGGLVGALEFTQAPEKAAGPFVSPVLKKLIKGFKKKVPIGRKIAEKFGKLAEESVGQFLKRTLVDRLAPLEDLAKKAVKELPFAKNFYKRARLHAGISGKYTQVVDDLLTPTLKREANRLDDLSALLYLQRAKEVGRRGIEVMPEAEIAEGIAELRVRLGNEGLQTLRQSAEEIVNFGKMLLKEMRDSGLISKGDYARLSKAGEYWVPLEVVSDGFEDLLKEKFARGSLNVSSKTQILKALKGSAGAIRKNPLETLIRRGHDTFTLADKNKVLKSLAKFGEKNPDLGVKVVKSIDAAKRLGLGAVSYFDDGVKKVLGVPKPVEIAVKNLSRPSLGLFQEVLGISARIQRVGATTLSIGFIPVNVIRDFGDAVFTKATRDGAKEAMRFVVGYPKALYQAAKRGDVYKQFIRSGGAQATLTSQIFTNPEAYLKGLAGKKGTISKVISAPKDLLWFISRVGEESTRLAEFMTQRGAGKLPSEAAFLARDITVDFARSGSLLKVLNSVIPFLNANVQGVGRVAFLAKDNPAEFALWMGIMGGTPSTMLYLHNSQFEDFKDIPTWEKNTNWIFLARDRTEQERADDVPLRAFKVPKPHFFIPFTTLLEGSLEFLGGEDKEALDVLADAIEELSPVGLPVGEERLGRSISRVMPGGTEALGILSGLLEKEPFTGRRVVPRGLEDVEPEEQFTERTPEAFVRVGKLLGVSPAKLSSAWRAQTGGGGKTLIDMISQFLPRTLVEPEGEKRAGEFAELPVVGPAIEAVARRFKGVTPAGEEEARGEEIREALTKARTRLLQERREAKKVWAKVKTLSKEEMGKRLKSMGRQGILTEEIYERVKDLAREHFYGITPMDELMKTVSPKERAELIAKDLEEFPTREAKVNYLRTLQEKGILTERAEEELRKILGGKL